MKPRIGRNSAEIFSAGFRQDVGIVLRWNGEYVDELNKTERCAGFPAHRSVYLVGIGGYQF